MRDVSIIASAKCSQTSDSQGGEDHDILLDSGAVWTNFSDKLAVSTCINYLTRRLNPKDHHRVYTSNASLGSLCTRLYLISEII
jgi:hypothetical protein